MDYKLIIVFVTVLNVLRHRVFSLPLISSIFKGIPSDLDDNTGIVPYELPKIQDPTVIDLSVYGASLYGQPDFNITGHLVANFKPNESSVNPEELGTYLEGDILIPNNMFFLKNGLKYESTRWPNGVVPFVIDGNFTNNELLLIAYAMFEYHSKTCIRFKRRTSERDYISIIKENSGCWSSIGRIGGKQLVNLQTPGCMMKPGTAMHELMHVLGFIHEQNRKERDTFVGIQFQNIQRHALFNFERMLDSEAFGVNYDYGSVMHYSPTAFSRNGLPTILPKKHGQMHVMGQRNGFSPFDIVKINRMYNCDGYHE